MFNYLNVLVLVAAAYFLGTTKIETSCTLAIEKTFGGDRFFCHCQSKDPRYQYCQIGGVE